MTQIEIEAMIRKFRIELVPDGRIKFYKPARATEADINAVRVAKPEIVAYMQAAEEARKTAAVAREAMIRKNLPGLEVLREAIETVQESRIAFERAMERGDGILPAVSKIDVVAIAEQYPSAAAYLKAEAASMAAWDIKATAGKRAMERLIKGDTPEQVLADMEKEVSSRLDWNN